MFRQQPARYIGSDGEMWKNGIQIYKYLYRTYTKTETLLKVVGRAVKAEEANLCRCLVTRMQDKIIV
jgi:hypothetical protein